MPIEITKTSDPKVLEIHVIDQLVHDDYRRFVP